ncbi:MAG: hypothetical protein M0Q88_09735 [Bacilli bacterium]|nr:hypothetical protein [Bacilli bacterium]
MDIILEDLYNKFNNKKINLIDYLIKLHEIGKENLDLTVKYVTKLALMGIGFIEGIINIIDNNENPYQARFEAFYILCVYYRRLKEITKFSLLLDKYQDEFRNEDLYKMQKAVYLKTKNGCHDDLLHALSIWSTLENVYTKSPAFIQAFADTVALAFENDVLTVEKEDNRLLLDKAIKQIKEALWIREYSKYYATLGRLLAIQGEYEKTIEYINLAIDKEDSSNSDYAIRIGDYQNLLTSINIKRILKETKNLNTLRSDLEKIKNETEKAKFENLSFLGFFTALLSLIIGSIQLAQNAEFADIIRSILVLSGGLILALGAFNMILLKSKQQIIISIILFGIGLFIIILALTVVPLII